MILALVAAATTIGFPAPSHADGMTVHDISGARHTIPKAGKKATVLLFVATDCPIANRMVPEINRIVKEYQQKGVAFYFVYPDKRRTPEEVIRHRNEFGLRGAAVIDRRHDLVNLAKAIVTPQAAVLLPSGELAYTGRINNLFSDHNKPLEKATRNELRDVLREVVAGKPVTVESVPAIGCTIIP